ncbi:non-specific lipid-transfer protein-like [Pistacia vera]|uniref:non-specific lipid-transfer protein-like n=1 Tax=Pistacia vera TaxID=55513 RepID=UPI001262CF15|nr:non-specific lipid-transfer protein-like [Pistacia vera]
MASLKLVCALVMCMMVSAKMAYALDCKEVINDLSPCEDYLFGSADKPSSSCCSGVKSLNNAASTKALRQEACNCMKSFAESYPSKINVNNAVSLAKKCEVKLPFTISTSTNCASIK